MVTRVSGHVIPDGYVEHEFAYLSQAGRTKFVNEKTRMFNLDGVSWTAAEVPPRRHTCWPQTIGVMDYGTKVVHRCACGAIRMSPYLSSTDWSERNSRERNRVLDGRTAKPEQLLPSPWPLVGALLGLLAALIFVLVVTT